MGLSFSIAIYFIVWWLVLFVVLPFGVHSQDDAGTVVPGTPGSAPLAPRLLRTALITTVLSGLIFTLLYQGITRKWIPLKLDSHSAELRRLPFCRDINFTDVFLGLVPRTQRSTNSTG